MKTIRLITVVFVAMAIFNSALAKEKTEEVFTGNLKNLSIEYKEFKPTFQRPMTDAHDQTGFHIGIRYQPIFGDMNINTMEGNTVVASMEASHGFAVSFNYYFNNWVGTHLEIMWARQTYSSVREGIATDVNLSYLSFPLMASLNTNYGRKVNLNIAAGPYLGINLDADATIAGTGEGTATTAVVNVGPLDMGIAYGGGVDVGFGATNGIHLRAGYRGTTGLLDLQETGVETGENEVALIVAGSKMQTHGFYLGLMFRL
jgi:hypothetical protein